jgi:rRNA-processing protein FCF1
VGRVALIERDNVIRTITDTVKLLNRVADNPLIAQSVYPELQELADAARQQGRDLILAVGKIRVHWPDE